MLICATVVLPFINKAEDSFGDKYKDTGIQKAAAAWLLIVASIALPYHIVMLIVRYLLFYLGSRIKKCFIMYGVIVSA